MTRSDVIILGGGLIGLALAAALDSSGLECVVVDPVDPDSWRDAKFDGRTSAVSSSSRRMLDTIGVGAHFPEPGCPIRTIRVADGLKPGSLAFEPPAGDDEPLGWMHENRHLRQALKARAEAGARVDLRWKSRAAAIERGEHQVVVRLEDGSELAAPLLVAAEGRNSPTREAAGIRIARWQYDHAAIVSTLRHERPHDHVAWEIFYPAGPFALLPMTDDEGGHRSAIVWSVQRDDAAGFLALSDAQFAAEAEAAMGGFLGRVELLAPRSPILLAFTTRRGSPIGACAGRRFGSRHPPDRRQGLNLVFRDVAALVQVLSRAPGRSRLRRQAADGPLPEVAQSRHTDSGDGDRQPDGLYAYPQAAIGGAPLRHGDDRRIGP